MSDWVDKGLPAADRARMAWHLAMCSACRTVVANLRSVVTTLAHLRSSPLDSTGQPHEQRMAQRMAQQWRRDHG